MDTWERRRIAVTVPQDCSANVMRRVQSVIFSGICRAPSAVWHRPFKISLERSVSVANVCKTNCSRLSVT